MFSSIDAIILAGSGSIHEKKSPDEGPNKALVKVGSRFMIDYVVDAIRNCPAVKRTAIVGPADLREVYPESTGVLLAAPGDAPLDSFRSGIDALQEDGAKDVWLLVCTGDIPFITTDTVNYFLEKCTEKEANFYYPLVKREAIEQRYPGAVRTYAKIREGACTGGNMFLINQAIVAECLPLAEVFIRNRKDAVAMVRQIGLGFLLRYILGMMDLSFAEKRVSALFGTPIAGVICDRPEIGMDVDKPSDMAIAERELAVN